VFSARREADQKERRCSVRLQGFRFGGGGVQVAAEFASAADSERPFLAARVKPSRMAAYVAAFLAATLFSAKGIFAKKAYEAGATPDALLALRFAMAAPVFAWVAFTAGRGASGSTATRLTLRDWGFVALLGGGGIMVSSLLDFHGLRYISVGLERMILYSYPAMVVLITAWIARRRPGRGALAALALSYLGLAVAFTGEASFVDGRTLWMGGGLVLAAALIYALYLVGSERLAKRLGAQRLTSLGMLACAALMAPIGFASAGLGVFRQTGAAWFWIALMAFFGTVVPALLTAHALRRIGAARMSIVGTAGAVAVLPLAALFLGEPAGLAQWGGFALTVAGGALLTRK
jgi:drug/metabolite transporter (DMT)-like permease